jgi:hypothetical protein
VDTKEDGTFEEVAVVRNYANDEGLGVSCTTQ